jgi:hypothetical protein
MEPCSAEGQEVSTWGHRERDDTLLLGFLE